MKLDLILKEVKPNIIVSLWCKKFVNKRNVSVPITAKKSNICTHLNVSVSFSVKVGMIIASTRLLIVV